MSRDVIGVENCGFTIIDEVRTGIETGFALGEANNQFVTWWYKVPEGFAPVFAYGHYIPKDHDAPMRTKAKAYADLYRRAADTLAQISRYGY